MIHLNRLKQTVNKAASSYHLHQSLQRQVCMRLVHLLKKQQLIFNRIADLACGIGASTQQLCQSVQFQQCFAIDLADEALKTAKQTLPDFVTVVHADFHQPVLTRLDLIFSNMGLHWSMDLQQTLNVISASLEFQGFLAFTMPIIGTFAELRHEYRLDFYDIDTLMSLLTSAGLSCVTTDVYIETFKFPNSIEALKSLKLAGTNMSFKKHLNHLHTQQHLNHYFVNDTHFDLSYRILLCIAQKTG